MKVIAHRGASRIAVENTLEAFVQARRCGADWIELDARRTADDVIVVHHDPRVPDGRAIVECTYADLPRYIPTLDAALAACDPLGINVEIKNDPAEPDFDPFRVIAVTVLEHCRSRGERILISSFDLAVIDRVIGLDAMPSTAWLTEEFTWETLETLLAHGHRVLHPSHRTVTIEMIEAAHRLGVSVNTWTVDDPDRMSDLIAMGIDGICTNVPDVLVGLLASMPADGG
ncbi:MAG: glycerophosphodiester phosphodiesterase [Acidimicrobiia bacterium]